MIGPLRSGKTMLARHLPTNLTKSHQDQIPLSALNERANGRYDVDSTSKIVVSEVRGFVQAVLAAPSGECLKNNL